MDLRVGLFYEEVNHDANINAFRIRIKILSSVASLTFKSDYLFFIISRFF